MTTVAIDFGAGRTRLAVYDRRKRRPTIRVDIPTLAYVPKSGLILIGEPAVEAIASDPLGAILDLKSRVGGADLMRNRHRVRPLDLAVQLFTELREAALRQTDIGDALTDCCLAIPLQFDTRQSESLQDAARLAGFSDISTIDAPIAAFRDFDRQQTIESDHAIVCDLGRKARLAVLCRRDSFWRTDQELQPPREWEAATIPPSLLIDALESIASRLAERQTAIPPLLLVGANAKGDGLIEAFRREGWKGEVIVSDEPSAAIALGAVDTRRTCPECRADQVPLLDLTCLSCGCPSCPECHSIVDKGSPACRNCGYPLKDGKAR